MSPLAALARLGESISSHTPSVAPDAGQDRSKLPDWSEAQRGVPNISLRSALFSSSRSSRSGQYLERAEIFTQRPTRIWYTGQRLNQADHDVWITLLHLARGNQLGLPLQTSAYALLKQQDKTDTGDNRKSLYKCLARLKASTVEIIDSRYSYTGSLIDAIYRDESTHELIVTLNPKLCNLFGQTGFTRVDWNIRRLLANKPLAQWLHGYLASHAAPYPVSITKLIQMAGSADRSASSAEQNLRRALDSLTAAYATHQKPFSYRIRNGKVHIQQSPSGSQRRHLEKKSSTPKGPKSYRCIG